MKGLKGMVVRKTRSVVKGMRVHKRSPLKRTNKNKITKKRRATCINLRTVIPDIVSYLKFDSYFYSHFISSSTPSYSPAPLHDYTSSRVETILANKLKVKEKREQYLKSDT